MKAQAIRFNSLLRHARLEKGEKSIFVIFNRPVQYLSIVFNIAHPLPVRIYNEDQALDSRYTQTRGHDSVVEFQLPAITAFSYPLVIDKFSEMTFVEKSSDTDACDLNGWEKLHTVEYKSSYIKMRLKDLFDDCFNFYLPKGGSLRDKRLAIYESYLDGKHYQSLVKGLGHRQLAKSLEVFPERDRNILFNTFFLSIMDPNIAQILGLYYIDTQIQPGKKYDYRIKANYGAAKAHCGTVYQLGGDFDPLPALEGLEAEQANDSFFQFDKTLSRFEQQGAVQLHWRKPAYPGKTDPVSYFMVREPNGKLEFSGGKRKVDTTYTHDGLLGLLVLPLQDKEKTEFHQYNDARVKVESNAYELSYQLFGVDAYGRAGPPTKAKCLIRDLSVPAAPVSLRITERSTGSSTKQFLQFKYGPFQYLRDPDAAKFMIHKKRINARMREAIRYKITDNGPIFTDPDTGKSVFRITVEGLEIKDLADGSINSTLEDRSRFRFISFQPAEDLSSKKLALKHRIKYRIRRFIDGKTLDIETLRDEVSPVQNGKGYLYADSAGPLFWENVGSSVPVVDPQRLSLVDPTGDTRELSAKILMVRPIEMKIYGSPEGPDLYKSFTEIIIDRALFRSGMLNNGSFRVSTSTSYTIKAQSSVSNLRARISDTDLATLGVTRDNLRASLILLEGSISLTANQKVFLLPPQDQPTDEDPNPIKGIVKLLFKQDTPAIANEGELLLHAKRSFISAQGGTAAGVETQDIPVSVELLSDIRSSSANTPAEAWVYMSKPIQQVVIPGRAFYFRNYETEITSLLPSVIPDGMGTVSAYFGVRTVDKSDQHNSSALSLPVQHIVAKTDPPAVPPAVYSCLPPRDGKLYVPLPNKDGRSALCLRWDKLPDSQHPPSTRFELSRALDVSIISALRAKWSSCDLTHIHPSRSPIPAGESAALENIRPHLGPIDQRTGIGISNLRINDTTGVYEGLLSGSMPTEEEKKLFIGGRIKINDYYFGVTGFNGDSILLRKLTPTPGPVNFPTALSNLVMERLSGEVIKNLLGYSTTLKQLADALPDAFSMITKVPVRCQPCTPKPGEPDKKIVEYIDLVPGTGNGKLFYKVRAVDAAENRSGWSDASDPIYQVNTTPPDILSDFHAETGDRSARIYWKSALVPAETKRIELFRFVGQPNQNVDFNNLTPLVTISGDQLQFKKIIATLGILAIPAVIQYRIPSGAGSVNQRISGFISQLSVSIQMFDTDANLFTHQTCEMSYEITSDNSSFRIIRIRVKKQTELPEDIQPAAIPDERPLRLTIDTFLMEQDTAYYMYEDTGLVGGLDYCYSGRAVRAIKIATGSTILEPEIEGAFAQPIKIKAIDRSIPAQPTSEFFEWIANDGTSVSFSDLNATRVKITIASQYAPTKIVVYRRIKGDSIWETPSINNKRGWQPWSGPTNQLTLYDDHIIISKNLEYGIQLQTVDFRMSELLILTKE